MVTRASWRILPVVCWFMACSRAPASEPEALVLRGFRVVDPASRTVTERDVVVQGGLVVASATSAKLRVVEGRGQFLMPAFWDVKAALWGNNSTKSYDELSQDMTFSRALAVQLYYGVAHVGVYGARREWAQRMLKRADALELSEAEPLYPDLVLCAKERYGCAGVPDGATLQSLLDDRKRHAVPFVMIAASTAQPQQGDVGLRPELLAAALRGTRERQLRSVVTVDDWQRAAEVAELGASAVYGLPEGDVPDAVVEQLRERNVAYAPALALYLELDQLLGNERALSDPFLTATVQLPVLDSYRSERDMFPLWRQFLEKGRTRKQQALSSVGRLARAGVRILVASDACWAGTFQGHASHAAQFWLERAGLDGWTRLSAATSWPAELLGRRVGFEPGHAADFLAVAADPLERAEHSRDIRLVIRKGKLVDRESLLPDLERREYR
jgi:hypothetical protein